MTGHSSATVQRLQNLFRNTIALQHEEAKVKKGGQGVIIQLDACIMSQKENITEVTTSMKYGYLVALSALKIEKCLY